MPYQFKTRKPGTALRDLTDTRRSLSVRYRRSTNHCTAATLCNSKHSCSDSISENTKTMDLPCTSLLLRQSAAPPRTFRPHCCAILPSLNFLQGTKKAALPSSTKPGNVHGRSKLVLRRLPQWELATMRKGEHTTDSRHHKKLHYATQSYLVTRFTF